MLDMLPSYFSNLYQVKKLVESQGEQFDQLDKDVESLLKQGFIHTATWGLKHWERQYLLPHEGGSVESRRARILEAKARSRGDLLQMLRLIEPTVEAEWHGWGIGITFVYNNQAIFESLVRVIKEEKPAHLLFKLNPIMANQVKITPRATLAGVEYARAGFMRVGETAFERFRNDEEVKLW